MQSRNTQLYEVVRCKRGFYDTQFVLREGLLKFILYDLKYRNYCNHSLSFVQRKMLIKVNPENQATLKLTWTSSFVVLLIKILFLPVTIEGDKVSFRWLSWKTLFHLAFTIGVFFLFMVFALSSIDFWGTLMTSFSTVIMPKFDKKIF